MTDLPNAGKRALPFLAQKKVKCEPSNTPPKAIFITVTTNGKLEFTDHMQVHAHIYQCVWPPSFNQV